MRITLELPPLPIDQGTPVTGLVRVDTEGEDLAAIEMTLDLPGIDVASVDGTAFGAAGDVFVATLSDDGSWLIVASGSPLSGVADLVRFDAVVTGLRGREHRLSARVSSAASSDLTTWEGLEATATLVVTSGAPGIATTSLGRAEVGVPFAERLTPEGGQPPYEISLEGGSIPDGLSLDVRGLLLGTPTTRGDFAFTARVRDSATPRASAVRPFTMHVDAARPLIVTADLPPAAPGHPFDVELAASGGLAPLTWTATGFPAGLAVSGTRLTGTIDPSAPLGTFDVVLGVTDSESMPRTQQATLRLTVTAALPVQRIELAAPGAIVAARDLFVADYDVIVTASLHRDDGDSATNELLDRALDDTLTELVREGLGPDGILGGDRGGPRGPRGGLGDDDGPSRRGGAGGRPGGGGDPGDDDGPVPGGSHGGERPGGHDPRNTDPPPDGDPPEQSPSDRTKALLQQWRWLYEQRHPRLIIGAVFVDIEIDGRHAMSWSNRRRLAPVATRNAARPLSARRARRLEKLRRVDRSWIANAHDVLAGALGLGSPAKSKSTKRKREATRLSTEDRGFLDARLRALVSAAGGIDWTPTLDPGPLRLTTGRHRVRVTPSASIADLGGSLGGSLTAATTSVSFSVTFRARNPEGWPRLQGDRVIQGTCGRGEHFEVDVDLPTSAIDVACVQSGRIVLLPWTGDAERPLGGPRDFPVDLGDGLTHVEADAIDAMGRTWLVAGSGDRVAIARNVGVGGFARVDAALPSSGALRQLAIVRRGSPLVVALLQRHACFLHGIPDLGRDPVTPLRLDVAPPFVSGVANDTAQAMLVAPAVGQRWALTVATAHSGQVTSLVVDPALPIPSKALIAGWSAIRLLDDVAALAASSLGGIPCVVAARHAVQALSWLVPRPPDVFHPGPSPNPLREVSLPLPPKLLESGPGPGLTVVIGPARQSLYVEDATTLHALDMEGGSTALSCLDGLLALSRYERNDVLVLLDRRG